MLITYETLCRECASYVIDQRWADVILADDLETVDFIKSTSILSQSEEIERSFSEFDRRCQFCGCINWQVDKIKVNEINYHSHLNNDKFYIMKINRGDDGNLTVDAYGDKNVPKEFRYVAVDLAENYSKSLDKNKFVPHESLIHNPLVEIVVSCKSNVYVEPETLSDLKIEKFYYVGVSYEEVLALFSTIRTRMQRQVEVRPDWRKYV